MITCEGENGEVNAVEFKVISYASYERFCGVVLSQSIRVDTTSDSGSKQSRFKQSKYNYVAVFCNDSI